jgi:phosphoribosylaminoimidazole-succinocarboxamide synthase
MFRKKGRANVEKTTLLYEGKAKKLFKTDDPAIVWVEYLNQATALNGAKKDQISGKGELNNQITAQIFNFLKSKGINNHFIELLSEKEQLIQTVEIIPLEVVVRNVAAGSFSKRLAIPEGTPLNRPIVEFYYKNDALDDPMIIEDHIEFLQLATTDEIAQLRKMALEVDEALTALFDSMDITLIDFKLEFSGYLPFMGQENEGTFGQRYLSS